MLIPFETRPDFILPENDRFTIDGEEISFLYGNKVKHLLPDGNKYNDWKDIEGYNSRGEWIYSGEIQSSTGRVVLNTKFKR
jgi:hypothetical protein